MSTAAVSSDMDAPHTLIGGDPLLVQIGFTRFAEEVDRHRDDLFERSPVAPLAKDLVYSCRAIGRAQE